VVFIGFEIYCSVLFNVSIRCAAKKLAGTYIRSYQKGFIEVTQKAGNSQAERFSRVKKSKKR
jgi:hypothetical protein